MPELLPPYHWRNIHPNASLHYVRDVHHANLLIHEFNGPVGFDLEWKPTFTKNSPENPVAIVQLANESTILIIQVSAMTEFPIKLKEFLENPEIIKAGVAIQNDAKKLFKDYQISLYNCVDLSLLARSADNPSWKGKYSSPLGLARLIEHYESLTLPKGRVSRSNWEGFLSAKELDYAANDAHAGFILYQRLDRMAKALHRVPKTIYYTFNAVRGNLCDFSGEHWNCRNPDYDPGPPPPPKLPKPPTARDIRRANARSLASLGANSGATSETTSRSGSKSESQSVTIPRSTQNDSVSLLSASRKSRQIDFLERATRRRLDSQPGSNTGTSQMSSPASRTKQISMDSTRRRYNSNSGISSSLDLPSHDILAQVETETKRRRRRPKGSI